MKKFFVLPAAILGLLALSSNAVRGQGREKEISLAFGPYHQQTLDEQASPLLYKTHNSNTAAFTYTRRAPKSEFSFKLNPGWGSYSPERFKSRTYGNENYTYSITPTLYALHLKVSYLRKLKAADTKPLFFIGGELSQNLFISDQIANTYWATNLAAFNLAGQSVLRLSDHQRLSVQASIPVVAMVSRFNYANFPKSTDGSNFVEFFRQGSELVSVNKLQKLNLEARYSYALSRRFGIGATYQFSWFHYPEPRPIRSFSQALLLHTSYYFKFK